MIRRHFAVALATLALFIAAPLAAGASQAASQGAGQTGSQTTPAPTPVNLNTATAAELEKLPGVGPAVAARILEYRQKAGGFKKIEDLMNVRGIGERTFLRLKPLVTIAPPKTSER
jgi:competence protein ComEA